MLDRLDTKILKGDLFMYKETSPELFMLFKHDGALVGKYGEEFLDFLNDKDGFFKAMYLNEDMMKFFEAFDMAVLYGVYENKKFVVTGVSIPNNEGTLVMQHFEIYHLYLAYFNINYRMPICKLVDQKDTYYIERIMDTGLWHLKNYKQQIIQSFKVL
jgi:hypothetical protein